jgi:Pyruvate/2-oxoacid:ferredoxin oxidoreductase delta subunit
VAIVALGLVLLIAALLVPSLRGSGWGLVLGMGTPAAGTVLYYWLRFRRTTPGIKHDGIFFASSTGRGLVAWGLGVFLTGLYVAIYWWPALLESVVRLTDPLSQALRGSGSDPYFLYSFLYTMAVLVFGGRMFMKYRHSRYHLIRTSSVMVVQLGLAFLIPRIMQGLDQPEYYFSYFWPLLPDYLFPADVRNLLSHPGGLGVFLVGWGVIMSFVAVPLLTYYFGKRWYCSWVCGCGGLAETLGDPFRHLSDKSSRAWKIERWSIHSVLVLIIVTTAALWMDSAWGVLGGASAGLRAFYKFAIVLIFAGVVGVGFYPILGSRVWCRFGCPQAAILGIVQRFFSRFRITTNGGQCMSCGNCSTYCEMGIDVRAYAQRGANIVRASCVGCGVCASVCPRGVLRLENGSTHRDRFPGAESPLQAFRDAISPPRADRPSD